MAKSLISACPLRCPTICEEKAKLNEWQKEAEMADAVYQPFGQRHVDGYTEVTDAAELRKLNLKPSMLNPTDSQFQAAVFRKNGTDEYEIAFKGTTMTSGSDWWQNIKQGSGNQSDYYTRAQQISRNASERVGKENVSKLSFTGHSLGGGLASAAARATGQPATTFNAAGLHNKTVTLPVYAPIDAVRVKGEVLTAIQSSLPVPEAARTGQPYSLDPPANIGAPMELRGFSALDGLAFLFGPLPGMLWNGGKYLSGMASRSVELHGMKAVKDSLKQRIQNIAPQAGACGC